jgi:phospholipase/carboxylesterase
MSASGPEQVLVLLHGRWYRPDSMQELTDRLDLPGVRCVAPAAPERTWYPKRFFDPREANEPQLSQAIETVHQTLDQLAAEGVDAERVVVGGFSQGGCVTCDALARRPRRVRALVALCGGLIGPDDAIAQPDPGSLEGLPVLLTAIEEDEWVPVERIQRTADVLFAAGAQVDLCVFPPGDHEVHDEEVDAFRRLLLDLS